MNEQEPIDAAKEGAEKAEPKKEGNIRFSQWVESSGEAETDETENEKISQCLAIYEKYKALKSKLATHEKITIFLTELSEKRGRSEVRGTKLFHLLAGSPMKGSFWQSAPLDFEGNEISDFITGEFDDFLEAEAERQLVGEIIAVCQEYFGEEVADDFRGLNLPDALGYAYSLLLEGGHDPDEIFLQKGVVVRESD